MDLKTGEIDGKSSQKGDAYGTPEPGGSRPRDGAFPRILLLTAFTIKFLRFELHSSCFVWVIRREYFGTRLAWLAN